MAPPPSDTSPSFPPAPTGLKTQLAFQTTPQLQAPISPTADHQLPPPTAPLLVEAKK